MSKLGSLSGNLGRERKLLRDLNNALLTIETNSLGKAKQFGFTKNDINKSRSILQEFTARLREVLTQEQISTDLQPLVHRIKSGIKPLEDWIEDLEIIESKLVSKSPVDEESLPILEDVLSLLDLEFTEDLRRLYVR